MDLVFTKRIWLTSIGLYQRLVLVIPLPGVIGESIHFRKGESLMNSVDLLQSHDQVNVQQMNTVTREASYGSTLIN